MAAMSEAAASSNAIDLSRLPAPTVVEALSYESIFADLLGQLHQLLPEFDATLDSDPAVKVLQVVAYRELLLRQQFNDRARQVMTAYATGSNLDQLGALVGVVRLVITPADDLAGTPAVFEDDTAFRRRIVLAPESFSVAGPETAYVYHALTADPTIADASATSPAPGEVLVAILSTLGDGTASLDQIDAVTAIIGGEGSVRPLTDQVTVVSASLRDYFIDALLVLRRGPDPSVVLAEAQNRLAAYVIESRKLGRDVTLSAIYAALHVEGVQRVILNAPLADVEVDSTEVAHCVGSTVLVSGYGD